MNHPLRQVLVHLDASPAAAARLRAARRIAQQHGASLHALYGVMSAYAELPYAPEMAPAVASAMAELDDGRRADARALFDREMATPGPVATWGESAAFSFETAFAEQSFYADLLVLGQHDESAPAGGMPADFVEHTLMATGKPALVLPYTGWPGSVAGVVAIAWKPTREAARAVSAALPLLQRASAVHVLTWDGPGEGQGEVQGNRLDLAGFLRVHGVQAARHACGPEPAAIGEMLLSRAFDVEADLLVMGCYGHSRARELVLGGATRTILRSMTMPVLLAH